MLSMSNEELPELPSPVECPRLGGVTYRQCSNPLVPSSFFDAEAKNARVSG